MNNQELIQHLSNDLLHDFERALEASTSPEEVEFWIGKIDALEDHIEILHTSIKEECASNMANV